VPVMPHWPHCGLGAWQCSLADDIYNVRIYIYCFYIYIYVICARYVSSYSVAYLQYIMISYDYYLCLSPYFVLVIASSFPNERAKVSSERRECVEVSRCFLVSMG
jgi:hypothetical protein